MSRIRLVVACVGLAIGGAGTAGPAHASQIANHIRVARLALDHPSTPATLKDILRRHIDAYLAGAAGPDVFTNLVGQYDAVAHMPHYQRTGRLIQHLIEIAYRQTDVAQRERYLAYALGWMTHYYVDTYEHQLVNRYGGYYKQDHKRHVMLEMVETTHVLTRSGDPQRFVAPASGLPIDLVSEALALTYPRSLLDEILDSSFVDQLRSTGFVDDIKLAGALMEMFTRGNVDEFLIQGPVGNLLETQMGVIPLAFEYRNLLEPLEISIMNVVIDPRTKAGDKRSISAELSWAVHDDGLAVSYLSDWYAANRDAERGIVGTMRTVAATLWRTAPILPDMDLDSGRPEGQDAGAIADSAAFKRIEAVEISWAVLNPAGAVLVSGSQSVFINQVPIERTTAYRTVRRGNVAVYVEAGPSLFLVQNQKLTFRATLRMINNNRQLIPGRFATAFRFPTDPLAPVREEKVTIEATDQWRSVVDMPNLTDGNDTSGGAATFAGAWACPERGVITFQLDGRLVKGAVSGRPGEHWGAQQREGGRIEGTVDGRFLSLVMESGDGTVSRLTATLAIDGRSFSGSWEWFRAKTKLGSGSWSCSRPRTSNR